MAFDDCWKVGCGPSPTGRPLASSISMLLVFLPQWMWSVRCPWRVLTTFQRFCSHTALTLFYVEDGDDGVCLQVSAPHLPRAGLVRWSERFLLLVPSGVQPLLPLQMLRPGLYSLYPGNQSRFVPFGQEKAGGCMWLFFNVSLLQLVWATSSRIGCAVNLCYNMNVWGQIWAKAVYLVCNYSPK